jgi:enoyl-CoA hydratase/carnithine racemase
VSGSIDLHLDGPVARVVLRHPGKFNAMSRGMWRQLAAVFAALQARADLRAVIVAGADGHFCAGGDIAEYPAFRFDEAGLRDFHENDVWGGLAAMLACDLPLIAQIDGNCMGAGMEIASCCDIRIAGVSARFGAPIGRLGFPMAPREARLVAHAAGELTAREMLLEAAVLDAPLLLARGFLNRVVPDDGVATEAAERSRRVAALAPRAARMNKQTFRALNQAFPSVERSSDAIERIVSGAYAYADTPEHREGIDAFLAKRKPAF